tara:strand:+ start:5973 stop:6482 length:510 start_codon:yes stop_codon:yes gene_type:complete
MVDTIYTAAKAYGSAENKSANSKKALVDTLVAEGVKPGFNKQQDLGDGKKGYIPAAVSVREGLVASWGKSAVRLYNTDTKELSDVESAEKRYITKQLGTRMRKLNIALDERLNPVERGPVERKPDDVWLRDAFNAFVKRVESSEGAGDLDLVEIMEWLKKSPLNTFQPK